MTLRKLIFKPGANREPTNYANENSWWEMDKVRFRAGYPEKIGGWEKFVLSPAKGVIRALLQFASLGGVDMLAVGTSSKLYIENGATLYDITPIRDTVVLNNPFTTVDTSLQVNVTDISHGATLGDYVTISGVVGSLNGIPAAQFNKEHEIINVIDTDNYVISLGVAATSSGTPAAASITFEYQINRGLDVATIGTGWGTGPWSRGAWGSAFTTGITNQIRLWSFASYGENLLASVRDGQIFYWDFLNTFSNRAVTLSSVGGPNTPVVASTVTVTEDRHVVVFGTNPIGSTQQDRMLVRWSAQEDFSDWEPTPTNTAGDYRLTVGTRIISVQRTRQETLIWTDSALYSMQFLGPPYTFGFNLLAQNISTLGLNSRVDVAGRTFWMGVDKFYMYAGQVQPLPCDIRKYIFNDFNPVQAQQVFAGSNEEYNEVWWFYPSAGMMYPNKYVIYNYVDGTWAYGNMNRTAWWDSKERQYPIAADIGALFIQERGVDDLTDISEPVPITAYVQSADFDLDDGDKLSFIKRIIPDITFDGSTTITPVLNMTVSTRVAPGGRYYRTAGMPIARSTTIPVEQFTTQAWVRLRGRQMALRIESNQLGVQWQLGAPRIDIQPDGSNGRDA